MRSRAGVIIPVVLVAALGIIATAAGRQARSDEPTLDDLQARLTSARNAHERDAALDQIQERISDPRRLAQWLGALPKGVRSQGEVLLRRGWAHLAAGDPTAARPLLEKVHAKGGAQGVVQAYLGEVTRLDGDPERALELLAAACELGYRDGFVVESGRKAAYDLRLASPSKDAKGVPAYATALAKLVASWDHPWLRGPLARWLLEDYRAYAVPSRDRAKAWARFAAPHALAAAATEPVSGVGPILLLEAAEALRVEDRESGGGTLRFDLLAEAYTRARSPDGHRLPQAVALLAEAALAEQRYSLAHRLARERLTISDSPLARRVLDALPPDVGD